MFEPLVHLIADGFDAYCAEPYRRHGAAATRDEDAVTCRDCLRQLHRHREQAEEAKRWHRLGWDGSRD